MIILGSMSQVFITLCKSDDISTFSEMKLFKNVDIDVLEFQIIKIVWQKMLVEKVLLDSPPTPTPPFPLLSIGEFFKWFFSSTFLSFLILNQLGF